MTAEQLNQLCKSVTEGLLPFIESEVQREVALRVRQFCLHEYADEFERQVREEVRRLIRVDVKVRLEQ